MDDAKKMLARLEGCTEGEAYLIVTTVRDLRNGAVWYAGRDHAPPLVVGLEVPLPDPARREPE